MNVLYTCIFGDYEKLKEPKLVSPGWEYICFTDQLFFSPVWKVIVLPKVESGQERLASRRCKALFYEYVPDADKIIYIDGSFQINCNLDNYWNKHFKLPFSCPRHPMRDDLTDEYNEIVAGQRGGAEKAKEQVDYYNTFIKPHSGLYTSGIILRDNSEEAKKISKEWWQETSQWSLRDQLSLVKIAQDYKIHAFNYRYNIEYDFLYHPHKPKYNPITNTTHF